MTAAVDVAIVGQGLAGTTLAWRLLERGQTVRLFDPNEAVTSSKIAAGLITPITGKALTLSPTYAEELSEATHFYRSLEQRTGATFFHTRTAVRFLASEADAAKWSQRRGEALVQAHLLDATNSSPFDATIETGPHGWFAMRAAQLDTAAYLAASRRALDVVTAAVDWARDVSFDASGVDVCGTRARAIVSCEGAVARQAWPHLRFRPAKGEIMDIHFERPMPPVTLHRGIWLAPTRDAQRFRVGATFSWDTLDNVPTEAARGELQSKLMLFCRQPYVIEQHRAAVRPIIGDGRPVAAQHAREPRLYLFNGLGSKGALRAPHAATRLAAHIAEGTPFPADGAKPLCD